MNRPPEVHRRAGRELYAGARPPEIVVAYAPDDETADRALHAKAAMLAGLGVRVHLCGDVRRP
jgi:hypothetical protein